jgi:hypothetical protein
MGMQAKVRTAHGAYRRKNPEARLPEISFGRLFSGHQTLADLGPKLERRLLLVAGEQL